MARNRIGEKIDVNRISPMRTRYPIGRDGTPYAGWRIRSPFETMRRRGGCDDNFVDKAMKSVRLARVHSSEHFFTLVGTPLELTAGSEFLQ